MLFPERRQHGTSRFEQWKWGRGGWVGEERRGTVKYLLTVSHAWALLLKAPSLNSLFQHLSSYHI